MNTAVIGGKKFNFKDSIIAKELTFRELCGVVKNNSYYYDLYIFHPHLESDIDIDYKTSKKSSFKHYYVGGDDLLKYVTIAFKGKDGALPLWLIESNKWIVRIEAHSKPTR